jgi:uncharacterized membrane protein YhaH (DUF805 family)
MDIQNSRVFFALPFLSIVSTVLSQTTNSPGSGQMTTEESAKVTAGCAACGGSMFAFSIFCIVVFALNVALLVWVARDAKSRGMDSSVLWMVLVMLTSVIGLLIYIFSRPQGNLIRCPAARICVFRLVPDVLIAEIHKAGFFLVSSGFCIFNVPAMGYVARAISTDICISVHLCR